MTRISSWTLSFVARACSWFALALPAAAQQGADDCANATPISSYVYLIDQSTAAATPDGASSCGAGAPDVWYSLSPLFDGRLDLSCTTVPASSTLQPLLSVHAGCPGTAANQLGCAAQSTTWANLSVEVTRATTYWVRVSGANGSAGAFRLSVNGPLGPRPVNDDPADATDIGPGNYFGTTNEAESQWYTPCTYAPGVDLKLVWYRYVPSTSGTVVIDTCVPTTDDTVLAVYQGCSVVVENDDACGIGKNWLSYVTFSATAGVEYLISVREYFAGWPIDFSLHVSGPPRAGEICADATSLGTGTRSLLLTAATADGSSSCSSSVDADAYYAFTAPTDGRLRVSTCGTDDYHSLDSGDDTRLSIHDACPADALNELACSDTSAACGDVGVVVDAAVALTLRKDQTVYVRVARNGPASSRAVLLEVDFAPGVVFCAGDGSSSACPCGNTGASDRGCAHSSNASGAFLDASGDPEVANDTFTLHGSGMPATTVALYIQGSAQANGGAGSAFGDGLRCVAGAVVRLGARVASNGASNFGAGDGSGTLVSIAGSLPGSGGTRHYQAWFRDASPTFCTAPTFNLSNGLTVTWSP